MELSLCMIVRDEEEVLARCLDSVSGCVEELIIVDTGSTDRTKEIARAYTPHCYDFPWTDDFSAARNAAFSKATKDYLLWLDADDVLDEQARKSLTDCKNMLDQDRPDLVFCPYDVAFDQDGNPTVSFFRERIVRRCEQAVWRGRVHECIAPFGKTVRSTFRVRHLGSHKPRGDRNLQLYRKWAAEEPLSGRDLFYYGRELYYHKFYAEAIDTLTNMLDGDGWYVNKIEACKILAYCHEAQQDNGRALRSLFTSFCFGEPRAALLCEIGNVFYKDRKYSEAVFWYESAMRCRDHSEEGDFEEPLCRTLTPLLGLTASFYALGDHAKALAAHEQAEAQFPDHPSVRYNQAFFHRSL